MSKLEDALDRLDQSVRALTEAAHADDKTPLLNALAFRKHAPDALANVEYPMVLVFGDINQFKAVNEQYGHIAGDAAINCVGKLLHEIAVECDARAYRQSGDEFVLLLPEVRVDAFRTAARDKLAAASVTYLKQTFDVGISFGYVHADDGELHDLLKKAEEACSIAKGTSGSVVKWTVDIFNALPMKIRYRCAGCGTKFDCWIPKRKQSEFYCPGCGNAIPLTSSARLHGVEG